jgi:hypothetical protein
MAVADTLTEINEIINYLKDKADKGKKLDGGDKTTIEARIQHLRNKTTGTGTLTHDLNDLAGLGTPTAAGKTPIVGIG